MAIGNLGAARCMLGPMDAVGKKLVTVVFDASTTQQVVGIARERGVKPSQVYRGALVFYLAAQA